MNTLTFSLARAARLILEQKDKEKEIELLNTLRFTNLPRVGNSEPEGGIKMGSLSKLAEQKDAEKTAAPVKAEGTEEEVQYTLADKVKIAGAHLYNYVEAVKEAGGTIKTASLENVEINEELLNKTAALIVIDHYDLYKEAGINLEKLKAIIAQLRAAGQKAAGGVQTGALRAGEAGKALGSKFIGVAGKKGVQLGAAGAGGVGAGLGLGELLRRTEE